MKGSLRIIIALALALCLALGASCASGGAGASGASQAAAPVRQSVAEYSWAELSTIAEEVAQAPDDPTRRETVKRYHLVNDEGRLDGTQAKPVQLADGTQTSAVVVGFARDDVTGGGAAGITFMFADAVAWLPMNNDGGAKDAADTVPLNVYGGWNGCEVRAWLNGPFAAQLPTSLQAVMQSVDKTSVAVTPTDAGDTLIYDDGGFVSGARTLVETCSDRLWLPAFSELFPMRTGDYLMNDSPEWAQLMELEGIRYQLFVDQLVKADSENGICQRSLVGSGEPCRWWLRTAGGGSFSEVLESGKARYDGASPTGSAQGIVPCFAL